MNSLATEDMVRFGTPLLTEPGARVSSTIVLPIQTDEHVVGVRKLVREHALELKLSLVDQTKLVTAASELARNTIKYGGGGMVQAQMLDSGLRQGVRLVFADDGPVIADIAQALLDGFTSGGGMGLGLGGAKRLVDEFDIDSRSGEGTAVAIVKWKR